MSVSVVDVTRPPITTIARGRRISASGEVAKRNGKFAAIRRLRLIDEADQIAPTHIAEHGRETLAVFADHLDRAVLDDDLGDLRELHRSAIGNHHRDPRRIGGGCALAILVANDQRRAHLSFQNDAEIATIDPDAQRLCTCSAFQAEPPGLAASDLGQRYRIPALRSAKIEPGASRIRAAISRASRLSVGMSSPNTFTTTPRARR